jgi:plastocyanin
VYSASARVSISDYAFHPATITVEPGTKVTFTNHDQTAHTATSNRPAFDTGTVQPGHSATVTLKKPGTYTYYCQFHAFMHGTIVVK